MFKFLSFNRPIFSLMAAGLVVLLAGNLLFPLITNLSSFFREQEKFGGWPVAALACLLITFCGASLLLRFFWENRGNFNRLSSGVNKTTWLQFTALLLVTRLALSLTFMLFTPPLQGPDEPGHLGKALKTAGLTPEAGFIKPVANLMEVTRFTEHFPWLKPTDDPVSLYPPTSENLQLPLYYVLATGFLKAGNYFQPDLASQDYLVRLTSALLGLVMVGTAVGTGYLFRTRSSWLAFGIPLVAAFLPEPAYLSGVANNDNGAIAFGAVAAYGMALLFLRGLHPVYVGFTLLGLGLSIACKASANALIPGYLTGFFLLAWLNFPSRTAHRLLVTFPLIFFGAALAFLFFQTDKERGLSGWYQTPTLDLGLHAGRTLSSTAHSGKAVLALSAGGRPVEQQVNLFNQPDFTAFRISGWVKRGDKSLNEGLLALRVQTARETLTGKQITAGPDWQAFSFEVKANSAEISHTRVKTYLRLQTEILSGEELYLDDLGMFPLEEPGLNLLANPSFEDVIWTWKGDWENPGRLSRSFLADMLDTAQNGAALNYGTIFLQNTVFVFITFWGAFGWSQILFSLPIYLGAGVASLLALLGLLRWRSLKLTRNEKAFTLFCLLTLATTILALQIIRLPTSWMYDGTPDITHSRHVFPALIPEIYLFLLGLRGLKALPFLTAAGNLDNEKGAIIQLPAPGDRSWEEEFAPLIPNKRPAFPESGPGLFLLSFLFLGLSMAALLSAIFPFYYQNLK